eukprot:1433676-Rhodomonas_salina.1
MPWDSLPYAPTSTIRRLSTGRRVAPYARSVLHTAQHRTRSQDPIPAYSGSLPGCSPSPISALRATYAMSVPDIA